MWLEVPQASMRCYQQYIPVASMQLGSGMLHPVLGSMLTFLLLGESFAKFGTLLWFSLDWG